MYTEISILERNISEDEVRETVFSGVKLGLGGYVVPFYFLHQVREYLPPGIVLSCPIDWPLGLSDSKSRQLAAVEAIKRGANCLDLMSQFHYLNHQFSNKYVEDVSAIRNICFDRNVRLRVAFEYRLYDAKDLTAVAHTLATMNIGYLIPASGFHVEDFSDNLLACRQAGDADLHAVCGGVTRESQYQAVSDAAVYGCRFGSIEAAKGCIIKVAKDQYISGR